MGSAYGGEWKPKKEDDKRFLGNPGEIKETVPRSGCVRSIVKDIPMQSICEHHLLPFMGHAHIVYIPKNNVVTGLSKLVRLVDVACKRPQLQERLTNDIGEAIDKALLPTGVYVLIEAEHLCIAYRGIKKIGTKTITCYKSGAFKENEYLEKRAVELIKGSA